jgi:hypothetical protein
MWGGPLEVMFLLYEDEPYWLDSHKISVLKSVKFMMLVLVVLSYSKLIFHWPWYYFAYKCHSQKLKIGPIKLFPKNHKMIRMLMLRKRWRMVTNIWKCFEGYLNCRCWAKSSMWVVSFKMPHLPVAISAHRIVLQKMKEYIDLK